MSLQAHLEQLMSETGMTQEQVAKGSGLSGSIISQWRKGSYAGDNDKVNEKIANFLKRERNKAGVKELAKMLAQTETTKRILSLLQNVHETRENGLLYGGAGMGKTTALRHYAKTHPDVILIEAMPTFTARDVLKHIAKKIGADVSGSLNTINEAILEKLSGSGRMILVDEAENLSTKSLEILRRLHDQAEIGLVVAGTPRLKANLMGKRGELAQLFSRVGNTLPLPDRVSDKELAQIVRVTLPSLGDSMVMDMVKKAAGSPRRLWKLMYHADRARKQSGDDINADMLNEIDNWLIKN